MTPGTAISGIGHIAMITGLLFGGWIGDAPLEEPLVADVQIITQQEFAALTRPEISPQTLTDVPTPATPDIETDLASAPRPEDPEIEVAQPEATAVDDPDVLPDVPDAPDPIEPELTEDVAALPVPDTPTLDIPVPAPPSDTPAPLDAPRVAPIPVPETPLSPDIADTPTPRVSDDANTPEVAPDEPPAAPEEATTEIVTEAETPASAPIASPRPLARPTRTAAAPAESTLTDAIADAVADANAAVEPELDPELEPEPIPAPSVPTGPPLTQGEKDGLRVAVQQCWNVGSLSSDALLVTVVLSVSMTREGKPDTGSIRMRDYFGGSDGAARQAFEAARRAIIRCGATGYDLPIDKYEQWREIEMTFNPEKMRIK